MVQISQTEEDIKISIELNRLVTRKPDVVLLPQYIKFNNPPIFFERHLMQEIDEMSSFCRIFKNEARIILVKKVKGLWPEIFRTFSKEELLQKRLEIADLIVARNKERDQQAVERYENKKRLEIEKEIKRETAMRDRVKQFHENSCREALMVDVRKQSQTNANEETTINNNHNNNNNMSIPVVEKPTPIRQSTPLVRPAMASLRSSSRINVCFTSQHKRVTPKRESQEGVRVPGSDIAPKSSMDTVDE